MILLLLIWLALGVAAYFLARVNFKRDFGTYTKSNRGVSILLCIILAPIYFIVHFAIWFINFNDEGEASW